MPCRCWLSSLFLMLMNCSFFYATSPRYHQEKRIKKPAEPAKAVCHDFEKNKGNLPWPVKGTIVNNFGVQVDPKYGTKTKNLGIDIACKPNSPVLAIGQGMVSYADAFIGQGLMVIVEHGGGFHSVYARLGEIKVTTGQKIKTADIVGVSTEVLHFELRVDGKAVDPSEWLRKQ
ncbi:MAG: peptidoglycan DD-metalloendopeptidase family protein [candidate division WOR-3 bacterium]